MASPELELEPFVLSAQERQVLEGWAPSAVPAFGGWLTAGGIAVAVPDR